MQSVCVARAFFVSAILNCKFRAVMQTAESHCTPVFNPNGIIVASARFDDTKPGKREGFYFCHCDMRGSTTAIVGANEKLKKG